MWAELMTSNQQRADGPRRVYEGPPLELNGELLPGAFRPMRSTGHIESGHADTGHAFSGNTDPGHAETVHGDSGRDIPHPHPARTNAHDRSRVRIHRGLHQWHHLEFDESDPLFQKQLGLLKEDTKALRKAFQQEVDLAGLPYWVSSSKRPESRKEAQRLSILIRPFFTLDRSPRRPADRLRVRSGEWICVLHVDANGLLHATRAIPYDSPGAYHFSQRLMSQRGEVNRLYGQWPELAQFLLVQLKAVHALGLGSIRHSER